MKISGIIAVIGLAMLQVGCKLGSGEGELENPWCLEDVEMSFYKDGSDWVAKKAIPNIVDAKESLESISITSSIRLDNIRLVAPEGPTGKNPYFVYPALYSGSAHSGAVFVETAISGGYRYDVDNTYHRVTPSTGSTLNLLYHPVETHLGNWELELSCPGSYSSSSFSAELDVCFKYEE